MNRRVAIDAYIVEVLMRDLVGHDRKPSAFLVYLALWSQALGSGVRTTSISHQRLAEATGLSKSAVQDAIRVLTRRKLLRAHRASVTAVPEYTVLRPWVRSRQ